MFYFVLSKENRTYIYVYKYTPFVRGDEKQANPSYYRRREQ
jgi:hypothetical protein